MTLYLTEKLLLLGFIGLIHFIMKPLHSLVTAALFFTSCASTPEQIRRKERADRVAALANSAGAHFGLSPLERVMLERKARQIG